MLKKLTDPAFILPVILGALIAIALANNVAFIGNIVGRRA